MDQPIPSLVLARSLAVATAALAATMLQPAPAGALLAEAEAACDTARRAYFDRAIAEQASDLEATERLASEARELIEMHAAAPLCTGRLQEHLAYLLVMDERYEEASDTIEAYLPTADTEGPPRSRVLLRTQLAYALNRQGRTLEAAQAYFQAAERARTVRARFGVRALVGAAATARVLGDDAASEAYLRSALALATDSLGADERLGDQQGSALVSLALLTESRLKEAEGAERDSLVVVLDETTQQALDVLGTEGQALGFRSLALSLNALAAAMAGDRDRALGRVERSYTLARRVGPLVPRALFLATLTDSRVRRAFGETAAAERLARRASEIARALGSVEGQIEALEQLGALAEAQERWTEAADHYQWGVDLSEGARLQLGLQDWSPLAFARMQALYRGLTRVRLAAGDVAGAFTTVDMTRARYLRDLRQHLRLRTHLSEDQRDRVDSLAEALSIARLAVPETQDASERAAQTRQISELQSAIEAETGVPLTATRPLDLGHLQRALAERTETLVAYALDAEGSVAFVVRPDTLVAVRLDVTPARLRSALRSLGSPWRSGPPDAAFSLPALHEIHELLVAPVRAYVPTERVVIVPGSEAALVPFAALTTAPSDDFATAPYLVRDLAVRTEVAAALVSEDEPTPDSGAEVLAFGRTTFTAGSTWNGALAPLPHAAAEIAAVADDRRVDIDATEAAFRRDAADASVVHVATHAETNAAFPLYSRIALAPGDGEDGTLHLYEILASPLSADLVVLSGCSTASGGARAGEGIVGLQYGMRAAGAAATLATLWEVADDATADLMASFYDGLGDGLDKAEALRRAQLAYLERHDGLRASPFFWAAPVLSGAPAPVPIDRGGLGWWLALAAGATAAGGLAWRRRPTPPDA